MIERLFMEYELILSDRKTISASVVDGVLKVRAPRRVPKRMIDDFVIKHKEWIERNIEKSKRNAEKFCNLSDSDIKLLRADARKYFEEKTKHYADVMGLKYGRISITSAKTRFGSCSSKGNICYSYRLMSYPDAAREYVVVHELAHLVEMNHSDRFYKVVEAVLPDYKIRRKMLK